MITSTTTRPATPDANFAGSSVVVRHGHADIAVQQSAKRGAVGFPFRGRFEVVLRRPKGGSLVGRAEESFVVGSPRIVRVPIKRSVKKRIRHKNSHQVEVRATLKRIDGTTGTGDRTHLILQRNRPNLPF